MIRHRDDRPDDVGADVAWARATLGPANPVPAPASVTPPGVGLVAAQAAANADAHATAGAPGWLPPTGLVDTETGAAHPHRRARTVVVSALVASAALIAGIFAAGAIGSGGSGHSPAGPSGPSGQIVFASAAVTQAARTAQFSLAVTVGTKPATVQGAADFSTGAADFTAQLPEPIGSVEARATGTAAYVRVPSGLEGLTGGKPWVKADLSTFESLAGGQLGVPGLSSGMDFTGVLDWLRGVGQVTTVGTNEIVHGASTTHYRAEVDLTKAAANAPAAIRSKLTQAAQDAGQTVPVDVWIDAQGRLCKLTASFDPSKVQLPAATSFSPGPMSATLELWGFGGPVSVTAPPADQVTDLSGILGSIKGMLPGVSN